MDEFMEDFEEGFETPRDLVDAVGRSLFLLVSGSGAMEFRCPQCRLDKLLVQLRLFQARTDSAGGDDAFGITCGMTWFVFCTSRCGYEGEFDVSGTVLGPPHSDFETDFDWSNLPEELQTLFDADESVM